jgi:hypothetical protein
MSRFIKILHIDPEYRITHLIYRDNSSIRTSVPLQTAIELLRKEDFDLILSEPHNKAILKKQPRFVEPKRRSAVNQPFMQAGQWRSQEIRSNGYPYAENLKGPAILKVSLHIWRPRQIWRSNRSFPASSLFACIV